VNVPFFLRSISIMHEDPGQRPLEAAHAAEVAPPRKGAGLRGSFFGLAAGAVILPAVAVVYFWIAQGFPSVLDAVAWGLLWGSVWGCMIGAFEGSRRQDASGTGTMIGLVYGTVPAAMHLGDVAQWGAARAFHVAILGPMMAGLLLGGLLDRVHDALQRSRARTG
jgi:hypothetical protein